MSKFNVDYTYPSNGNEAYGTASVCETVLTDMVKCHYKKTLTIYKITAEDGEVLYDHNSAEEPKIWA